MRKMYRDYNDLYNYMSYYNIPQTMSKTVKTTDFGPNPFVVNIEEATRENNNFRKAIWTGNHLQVTLMNIRRGENIGIEMHPNLDQFLRIEQGNGIVRMGREKSNLNFQRQINSSSAILVPAGTWHNIINTGNTPLKLYSIYAPQQHPKGIIQPNKPNNE